MSAEAYNYYHYQPSTPLIYVALVGFVLLSIYQLLLLYKFKAWYFVPFVSGTVLEASGYAVRRVGADNTNALGIYIVQSLMLLLPPIFFAATIYMLLKKVIICLEASRHSIISVRWLTKILVTADIASLVVQSSGGSLQATGGDNLATAAQWITIFGLTIQLVAFVFFLYLTYDFQRGYSAQNDVLQTNLYNNQPWIRCIYAIYFTGALILIRSIFRVAEYATGYDGYLMRHEAYFYGLDTLPMLLVVLYICLFYPPALLQKQHEVHRACATELIKDGTQNFEDQCSASSQSSEKPLALAV